MPADSMSTMGAWAKGLLTWAVLSGVAALAAADLAPSLPWWQLPLWAGAGLLLVVALVGLGVRVLAPLAQWVLHLGGTDPQWLGLPDDPPGLRRPGKPPRSH